MRNLLTANFCRLKKNKLFWIITVGIFFLIAYSVIQGSQLCFNQSFDRTLAYYYFNVLPFSGLIAALFIAMFLGTDYSDGTIRNKRVAFIGFSQLKYQLQNIKYPISEIRWDCEDIESVRPALSLAFRFPVQHIG